MDDIVDALVFKLQSKICYHRDAHVEYREIKTMVDKLVKENKKLQDEKMEFPDLINSFIEEKENLQHDYQVIKEGVAPMKEQLETVKKELEKTKHEHVAAKKELEEAKHEHVAAKKELEVAKQQLAQRNEELEVLRKKFQESEAMHTQLHQQKESPPGPELVHSRRVTRSTHKRELSLQGLLRNDVDGHRPKKRSNQHAGGEDDLGGDQTETDQGRGGRVCAASLTGEGSDTNV